MLISHPRKTMFTKTWKENTIMPEENTTNANILTTKAIHQHTLTATKHRYCERIRISLSNKPFYSVNKAVLQHKNNGFIQ